MPKVFLSCIMRPIFLLNWYLEVPLGLLIPSAFHRCWLKPLTRKVREIFLIIICTIERLKVNQF